MLRAADKWFPGYLRSVIRRPRRTPGTRHLMFCVADHFEPFRGGIAREDARRLVRDWVTRHRELAAPRRDSDGVSPRHTFFYPAEEYDSGCLDSLTDHCAAGLGEVEIHLHHRDDTPGSLASRLTGFRDTLSRTHGLLGRDADGRCRYGFIHGNWALCNSRPDGDWCGVNRELAVLMETGCYADFTFPSAPSPTQPRTVNAIYYARDRQGGPRGHDGGRHARVGARDPREPANAAPSLLLVQGPLGLDWRRRKWGLLPRLENGDVTGANPPVPRRVDLWVRQGIHVAGRPEWVFVKVHTHGCAAANREALLGAAANGLHSYLDRAYNDGHAWRLHYVSARELYNIVQAAEEGMTGDPGRYRDYAVTRA